MSSPVTGPDYADRLARLRAELAARGLSGFVVPISDGVALGNGGGTSSVLDSAGLKVHGVSYTADLARREGWTIVF